MALHRIGPTSRPLGSPDRPSRQPAPALGADASDVDYPLAPLAPSQGPQEGAEGRPLPQAGMAALAAEGGENGDPAAMRPNQLFFSRQVVWQAPDTSMLASSWLVMVRTYAQQRAALVEQASGQNVPSSLFMADHTPVSMREGRNPLPLLSEMEPWRFAVYAWGAEKLLLRVVARDADSPSSRRRRGRIALRLELMLPGLGRVLLQLEPAGTGVVMEVAAAQNAAMQHMREMLPQMAAAVSSTGLSIMRCRLVRELSHSADDHGYPSRSQAATLSLALFKAIAELAVLLSRPLPPDDLFTESA
ncbi:hypothetical protein HSX11_17500 [Oxalobacteraceae bacterium]|nr:hypothetical protein [Oxalobacteraceae bacterium]